MKGSFMEHPFWRSNRDIEVKYLREPLGKEWYIEDREICGDQTEPIHSTVLFQVCTLCLEV